MVRRAECTHEQKNSPANFFMDWVMVGREMLGTQQMLSLVSKVVSQSIYLSIRLAQPSFFLKIVCNTRILLEGFSRKTQVVN